MTQTNKVHVTIVGCGKMGTALIQGWLKANLLSHADIIDPEGIPDSLSSHKELFHVKHLAEANLLRTDIVILCVKPQMMDIICTGLKDHIPAGVPILSIAAGKPISYFESFFVDGTPIIRVMPNLPATAGKGISALCANGDVTQDRKDLAQNLMAAVGQTVWLDNESLMDAVTALSGSGPAYIFYLIEAMTKAGIKAGLSPEQSEILARQTVIGSAALAEQSDLSVEDLQASVASKGGTTEAALEILKDGRFQEIIDDAILAARDRGKALAD